jgi:peptide/nickel transport system permease protein
MGSIISSSAFKSAKRLLASPEIRIVLRRVGTSLITLLIIAYLALFGLILAGKGQRDLAADPRSAAVEALGRTIDFVIAHPATYFWRSENQSALSLVGTLFVNSAGLLLAALILAAAIGIPVGITLALSRPIRGTTVILLLSVLAISTPSFLLAMLLWVVNIAIYQRFATTALPPSGFGWNAHLIMPALVLAARPLAQLVQVTYIAVSDVLGQDYIRTARAKGLRVSAVVFRHALRNAAIPILTTLGTSLRFSMASLPVVEYFFVWPGVGLTLLQAFQTRNAPLVVDLILSLGVLFLVINLALELGYQILDPRLREVPELERRDEDQTPRVPLREIKLALAEWGKGVGLLFRRTPARARRLPPLPRSRMNEAETPKPAVSSSRRIILSAFRNRTLLVSSILIIGLVWVAVYGGGLSSANPYQTHGLMNIQGKIAVPPFKPSAEFPWGSDPVGRDMQALVLVGAKQTLALALFGTIARVLVGAVLGASAAWWRGSWLDRLVTGAVAVWAAFPATLFAMMLILALGIQQGIWVFIFAICVVGWGELAQLVRGQAIRLKNEPYVEGARALGARPHHILLRHLLPNLLPSLLVLAVLEMGGVLMLLAELGFLNIFLGGGFRTEIGEVGRMIPLVYYFSDVPEWGALLANIRDWWRSYPWLAWYPGLFFFLAILAFNMWGEGLRRFLDESRIDVSRLFNRYTVAFSGVMVFGLVLLMQSNTPVNLYSSQARQFDVTPAMNDIQALSSQDFQGRESGTPGAQLAAGYIAPQMKTADLFPGGEDNTYLQTFDCPVFHLTKAPRLEVLDERGEVAESLVYRRDISEYIERFPTYGEARGIIVGLAAGPDPETGKTDAYGLRSLDLRDKVVIVPESELARLDVRGTAGILVVADDPARIGRKYLFHRELANVGQATPALYVSPQAAERLLETAGSSLDELAAMESELKPGEGKLTNSGAIVHLSIRGRQTEELDEKCYNVIGYISGTGGQAGLDSQVIIVSAYYDGLGSTPDATLYPGANDNASGVAAMLEMARMMKQGGYQPKKTLVFVAWSGGERYDSLSVTNIMNAKIGFSQLTVEAVLELSGVGGGDGNEVALGQGSSYRLVQLLQSAGDQLGVPTTTRGRSPHYGIASQSGFGGRSALTAYVSWSGSDGTAHTPQDDWQMIDPAKMKATGETTLLALTVLSREVNY